MRTYAKEMEVMAMDFLDQNGQKPNYSNRDFMNTIIIFQTALMDKMYDLQNDDRMSVEDREKMAGSCGESLRQFIKTYTGLDTHEVEKFL